MVAVVKEEKNEDCWFNPWTSRTNPVEETALEPLLVVLQCKHRTAVKRAVASGVRRTKPATEHAHDGALLNHSQICQQSQLQPSGHSEATHCRYQWLRQLQTGWTLEDANTLVFNHHKNTHTHIHNAFKPILTYAQCKDRRNTQGRNTASWRI